jgi:hypothetical protein
MTLAPLRTRLARLEQAAQRRDEQRVHYGATNVTALPAADRWEHFAPLTWVKTSGTVAPFVPYGYQIELIRSIHRSPNTIVNKSRQVGASETVLSYLGCRAATEPGFAAVIFSKTQADSSELGRRIRFQLNSIQGHSFRFSSDSNTLISIVGGGTLYFLPGSSRAARGIPSASVLWLDEAAFIEGAEAIYAAATPTLSMVGDAAKVIITSTPDLELDFFGTLWHHKIPADWHDYIKDHRVDELNARLATIDDDWNRVAVHYSQHPIYSAFADWPERTRESRRLSLAAWNAEYELSFGSTDSQIYPSALVKQGARGAWQECALLGREYVMGIDPNAGGDDYFVALVIDVTRPPYAVVAMYRANGRTTRHSIQKVRDLIEDFLPSRVAIEKQAMGAVIGEALQENLPEYQIELFNTSQPAKNTATDRILYFLEHDWLTYPPDCVIPNELRAFQKKEGGRREAAAGHHDDTVMALAIAGSLIPDNPNTAGFFDAL